MLILREPVGPSHVRRSRFNPYSAHHIACFANRMDATWSRQVHRKALEIGERAIAQRAFVGGAQDHARRLARLERFLPTRCTETPTIAGLEPGKAEFGHRG